MNDLDRIALNKFNPQNGDYLVVKGKGEYQHLECKHLRGSKIPFLGRILQKIVYPSFRFKKVIDYIFTKENPLEGINNEKLQPALLNKVNRYFRFDDQREATRHKALWQRVSASFSNAIGTEPESPLSPIKTSFFNLDNLDNPGSLPWGHQSHFPIPDSILNQLPRGHDYVIVSSHGTTPRVDSYWRIDSIQDGLKNHLEAMNKPIVLVVCFPDADNGYGLTNLKGEPQERLIALKNSGIIQDFCPLLSGYEQHTTNGENQWEARADDNKKAIEELKTRLNAQSSSLSEASE